MPSFDRSTDSTAPPIAVWKLLYDPTRIPQWWVGFESVEGIAQSEGSVEYTLYPEGYPDFPMPHVARSTEAGTFVMSCLTSNLEFEWRLEPLNGGTATRVSVSVAIPEEEAHRLETQQQAVAESLRRLVALAESA